VVDSGEREEKSLRLKREESKALRLEALGGMARSDQVFVRSIGGAVDTVILGVEKGKGNSIITRIRGGKKESV